MVTVAPVTKFVPVIVRAVPPPTGPDVGLTAVTVGAACTVYNVLAAFVPPGVVTRILFVPVVANDGKVQEMVVAFVTLKVVQAVPPTVTAVAPVKFVPVIVTILPVVLSGPELGATAVTVGAAA
jgi:hypothetical protein